MRGVYVVMFTCRSLVSSWHTYVSFENFHELTVIPKFWCSPFWFFRFQLHSLVLQLCCRRSELTIAPSYRLLKLVRQTTHQFLWLLIRFLCLWAARRPSDVCAVCGGSGLPCTLCVSKHIPVRRRVQHIRSWCFRLVVRSTIFGRYILPAESVLLPFPLHVVFSTLVWFDQNILTVVRSKFSLVSTCETGRTRTRSR